MDGDFIEAIFEGLGELGGSSSDNKKDEPGCGCALVFLVVAILVGAYFYFTYNVENKKEEVTKGKIEMKFPDNTLGIKTNKGSILRMVSEDLYENKKVGDSITIN